ncbi:transmembrane and TPR repeat-containing protein CG4050 [Caerostris darwini]|uniref:Transmembrane and TPR repeat-containing protein CG4050 n=1 Tax=Caerostris darwini TaxID=1538125 RepID=A0AAV4TWQ4_9ARAC|nr:transmembrane and TPR repeat-containing protein CG4050 [Caerostris darwini]
MFVPSVTKASSATKPHNVQALHNLCVVHVERGLMEEAETCLEKASALAPDEHYVSQHLDIVRTRRRQMVKKRKSADNLKMASKSNIGSDENLAPEPNLQT